MNSKVYRAWKLHRLAYWLNRVVVGSTLMAIIIRLSLKDHVPGLSVFYYATPLAVILIGSVISLVFAIVAKRRYGFVIWLIASVSVGLWWWRTELIFSSKAAQEDDVVVLFANIAHQENPTGLLKLIKDIQPDMIGLVETHPDRNGTVWQQWLPEYEIAFAETTNKLLAKKIVSPPQSREIGVGSVLREIKVEVRGQIIHCQIVDITSNPFHSRKPILRQLADLADTHSGENLLMMGDFNTPPESVHFLPIRKSHQNLFEQVGSGIRATWPDVLPVLSLDQIWSNRNLEGVSCRHHNQSGSDHRAVVGHFRLANVD